MALMAETLYGKRNTIWDEAVELRASTSLNDLQINYENSDQMNKNVLKLALEQREIQEAEKLLLAVLALPTAIRLTDPNNASNN